MPNEFLNPNADMTHLFINLLTGDRATLVPILFMLVFQRVRKFYGII